MHEWSIVETLLREVEQQAQMHGATRVHRLHLRVGALSGVEIPLLEHAYAVFREKSCCADAALEVEAVPARWDCPRCPGEPPGGPALRCARCGGPLRLASGDEIVLARIELERDARPDPLAEEAP